MAFSVSVMPVRPLDVVSQISVRRSSVKGLTQGGVQPICQCGSPSQPLLDAVPGASTDHLSVLHQRQLSSPLGISGQKKKQET